MAAERKAAIETFEVAGIQFAIDYSWLVIFALILWSLAAEYFSGPYPGYSIGSYWLVGVVCDHSVPWLARETMLTDFAVDAA